MPIEKEPPEHLCFSHFGYLFFVGFCKSSLQIGRYRCIVVELHAEPGPTLGEATQCGGILIRFGMRHPGIDNGEVAFGIEAFDHGTPHLEISKNGTGEFIGTQHIERHDGLHQ